MKIKQIKFNLLPITLLISFTLNQCYFINQSKDYFHPSGKVKVKFVNKSNITIKSVTNLPKNKSIKNLKAQESKSVLFDHTGEGTFQYLVNFENGTQIRADERYIEGGYSITEYIYTDSIIIDFSSY